jgi:hypothetical protein
VIIIETPGSPYARCCQGLVTLTEQYRHSQAEHAPWTLQPWQEHDLVIERISSFMTDALINAEDQIMNVEVLCFLVREHVSCTWQRPSRLEFFNAVGAHAHRYVMTADGNICLQEH